MRQPNTAELRKNRNSLVQPRLNQTATAAFVALLGTLLASIGQSQADPQKPSKATDENPPATGKWKPPYDQPPRLELLFDDDFGKDTRKRYHITSKRMAAESAPGDAPGKPPTDSAVRWQPGRLILHDGAAVSRNIDGDNWCELVLDLKFSEPAEGQSPRLIIRLDLEPSTDSYVELSQYWRDGKLRSRIAVFDTPAPNDDGPPEAAAAPQIVRSLERDGRLPDGKWRIMYRGGLWSVGSPIKATELLAYIDNDFVRIGKFSLASSGWSISWSGVAVRRVVPPHVAFSKQQRERLAEAEKLDHQVYRLWRQGRSREAIPFARRAFAIQHRIVGPYHPHTGFSLANLAAVWHANGDFTRAEWAYRQVASIRNRTLGESHPDYASSLNTLAKLFQAMGRYGAAEPLHTRVREITAKTLGQHHASFAQSLNDLGLLYHETGRYNEAEPLYKRAVAIWRTVLGEDDPYYVTGLNNLAGLYQSMGRYSDAELLCKRVTDIWKNTLGENDPYYATSLNNLAGLYQSVGRYSDAEPLYRQALEIRRRTVGENHPDYARMLHNLAVLYESMGCYSEAESLLNSAMKIRKDRLGKDHLDYVASLHALASLYRSIERYSEAEPLYKRVMEIRRERLGKDHPRYADSLNSLALLYHLMGRFSEAEPLYERAMEIRRERLGKNHPSYASILHEVAHLCEHTGRFRDAETMHQQAVATSFANLALSANAQSERQQLAMSKSLRFQLDCYVSLGWIICEETGVPVAESVALNLRVYRSVLAWKGSVTTRQRAIRLATYVDHRLRHRLGELQSVTSQLATLAFRIPRPNRQKTWQRQIATLSRQKDVLEAQLSAESSRFRQAIHRTTLEQLRAAIPKNAVLVDCLEYPQRGDVAARGSNTKAVNHIAAFIVRRTGPICRVDLGSSKSLEALVERWRAGYGVTADAAKAGAALREQMWEPLEAVWRDSVSSGETKLPTVLISPDGALARLPWNALPGREPGHYLIEEYRMAVVAAPQELPRLLAPDRHKSVPIRSMLLMAAVDYDSKPGTMPSSPAKRKSFFELATAGSRAPRDTDGAKYEFLSGTKGELRDIRDLYYKRFGRDGLTVLESSAASEFAFRREAPKHLFLHLATHGFFASPKVRSALDRSLYDHRSTGFELLSEQRISGYHPDLLSGIVLAGANRSDLNGDDGIMTAAEVATMDLSQVRLCVLSACETGLGRRAGGEGLLGLQRAFQIAGADTVVATLWKVDDRAARDLMERFYDNLWNRELGKLEALREAQLSMLRERERRGLDFGDAGRPQRLPPNHWAAFVLSGDWR